MYIGKSDKVISFENAKLLKDKGFEERCIAYYNIAGELAASINPSGYDHNALQGYFSAPSREDVLEWLRNKHDLFVEFSIFTQEELDCMGELGEDEGKYTWQLYYDSTGQIRPHEGTGKTPTQTVENAIKYILTNLI